MKRVKIEIEPLNSYIPQEKLDELKTILADSSLSEMHKDMMIRRISGISSIWANVRYVIKWLHK
jgi:hypothetical protein